MRKYLIWLLLAAGVVVAATRQATWDLPTERVDGTPISTSEIAAIEVTCDNFTSYTFPGPATSGDLDQLSVGSNTCEARARLTDGTLSAPSNSFTRVIEPSPPKPPSNFFISDADAAVIIVQPPAGGGGDSGEIQLAFTDLESGPNTGTGTYADGAFVTLYGYGFGATQGSGTVTLNGVEVGSYEQWCSACSRTGMDMITVQPGSSTSSGNFVVTNNAGDVSNGLAFTVDNNRNIREADGDSELSTEFSAIITSNSDDIVYMRAGTYDGALGNTSWGDDMITLDEDFQDVAFIGYPGEDINIDGPNSSAGNRGGWRFGDDSGYAHGILIANMDVVADGDDAIYCGVGGTSGATRASGTDRQRVVNVSARVTTTAGSFTGTVTFCGDDGEIYGSRIGDDASNRTIANNTHHLYVQLGAQNIDIGWNRFIQMRNGHAIQVHTDGTQGGGGSWEFDEIYFHDNLVQLGDDGNSRGFNFSNSCGAACDVYIWNNVFDKIGGVDGSGGNAFSVINIYSGDAEIYYNTLVDSTAWTTGGGAIWIRSGANSAEIVGNILGADATLEIEDWIEDETGSATIDGNVYYGRSFTVPAGDSNSLNEDPLLVDVGTRGDGDWDNRDYTLSANSQAIDHSDISGWNGPAINYDRLGNSRTQGPRSDPGAHEFLYALQSILFSGTVDQDYDRITIDTTTAAGTGVNIGLDFTLEFWIRPASSGNNGTTGAFFNSNLIFDRDLISGTGGEWAVGLAAGDIMWYQANSQSGGGASTQYGTTDLRDNTWHWIAISRDASAGSTEVYVDGSREINITSGTTSTLAYASGGTAKDQVLEIGGEKATQGTPAYSGYISEIRFSDVDRYSGASITVPTEPLGVDADTTAYYTFIEGTGSTVYDREGSEDASVIFNGGSTLPQWSTAQPY